MMGGVTGGLGGGGLFGRVDVRPATLPGRTPGGCRIEPNVGKWARLLTAPVAEPEDGSRMLCVRVIEVLDVRSG